MGGGKKGERNDPGSNGVWETEGSEFSVRFVSELSAFVFHGNHRDDDDRKTAPQLRCP